jgi:hypothetical protein
MEVGKLKKLMMMASMVLVVTAVAAVPSLAQHREGALFVPIDSSLIKAGNCGIFNDAFGGVQLTREQVEREFGLTDEELAEIVGEENTPKFCVIFGDEFLPEPEDRDNVADVVPASEISQETEQEAQSGDIDQSFNVSNSGDNSNQCAGIQGVANTGNAQNQISVLQTGSEADDFSFEDSGASITVSPSNTTTCDQQVNQAATASGW